MSEKESFFKYLSSGTTLTVLRNLTLKYTSTLDFNDPFDYNPAFSTIGLSKFIKRVGEDKEVKINRKKALKNISTLTTNEFRREAMRNFSVTCFSKSPHIVPMWAHYAERHTGCFLGFSNASTNELEEMLRSSEWLWNHDSDFLVPQDVMYTDTRPTIFNKDGITNSREDGADTYLIKAKAWEYEQEVRVMKMKPAGIYPFDKKQLRSVRFGLNIDPIEKSRIINEVNIIKKEHGLRIKIFDVKMDHRKFLLNDIKC